MSAIKDSYYTLEEMAKVLKVSAMTARTMIKELEVPVERIGKMVMVKQEDVTNINKFKILAYLKKVTGIDITSIEKSGLCKECWKRLGINS